MDQLDPEYLAVLARPVLLEYLDLHHLLVVLESLVVLGVLGSLENLGILQNFEDLEILESLENLENFENFVMLGGWNFNSNGSDINDLSNNGNIAYTVNDPQLAPTLQGIALILTVAISSPQLQTALKFFQ